MGDYWSNAVRHPEDVGVGYLRRLITFDMFSASGIFVPIGGIEAGALVGPAQASIIAAFNAGTSNDLLIGYATLSYVNGQPVYTPVSANGYAVTGGTVASAAGYKTGLVGAATGIPLATDVVAGVTYNFTGTNPTAGKAWVILPFHNQREAVGIPFPVI